MEFASPEFWIAVLQIIAIDLVLSGDNAVVIALACRNLPPEQRRLGVRYGVAGAIGLRLLLTFFAASLLVYPWIKLSGGLLLLWIGIKLLQPEQANGPEIQASGNLATAIKTLILADAAMSLDNVIGVAGAARGSVLLLVFGLAVSIPLIIGSSHLILKAMERFPFIVTLGAAILGYVAGSMMISDSGLANQLAAWPQLTPLVGPCGALLVVTLGLWLARRRPASTQHQRIL